MENNKPIIISNPEIVIEKRPGPNYIKTPLSEYKTWNTSSGPREFGGTWFNSDFKSVSSKVTEHIFNSRLLNKALQAEGQKIERKQDYDPENILNKMFVESDQASSYFKSTQHIDKIDINSLYGALGSPYFHQYKIENAIDITLSGQKLIKFLAQRFDDYFKNEFWKDKNFFPIENPKNAVTNSIVKIIETDSVTGDTLVDHNGEQIPIAKLFTMASNETQRGTNLYRQFKTGMHNTRTVNDKFEIEHKNINYVMKHTVEKEMFKIEVDGKSVIITADHSIMVERDGKLISVKPTEIQEYDNLITIQED